MRPDLRKMIKFKSGILILLLFAVRVYSQDIRSTEAIQKDLKYLASPELKGRKAGSEGDSLAAVYIRSAFTAAGLKPAADKGFQYFTLVTDVRAGDGNHLKVGNTNFTIEKDYQPFSFSTSDSVTSQVIFAGFGITGESENLKWDDYNNLDVKGKWVMILRGDPEPDNATSAFIPMASDRAKALTAKDKGAAGVLLVSPSSIDKSDKPIDITFDKSVSDAGLPVISITRKLASVILEMKSSSIDSLENLMLTGKKPVTFGTHSTLTAKTNIIREKATSRNVVCILEGSSPLLKNEYIVVGAHYDHLGMGGEGSGSRVPDENDIHYGADDNASGVSAIIELAKRFSARRSEFQRSVVFVAFGAEEMGIIGARYFVEHSPVPVKAIKAMVNLDMVGRLPKENPSISISGTGTSNVTDSLINLAEKTLTFPVKRVPDGYGPSDHAAFYTAGIPVSFITSGAHGDYHTPQDTYDKINYSGILDICNFTEKLTQEFSNLPKSPVFAEAGAKRESGHYGRNLKVTLGIMPDVSGAETSGGMKVEGTRKGAPAERAGMQKGDIITAINGMKVSNIYDYMSRLGKLKPGDVVNVEILRDNKLHILIIQL